MWILSKVIYAANRFYFTLVSGKSFVNRLHLTNLHMLFVTANKVLQSDKLKNLQISRVDFQIVKSAEIIQTIYTDGTI